MCAVAAFTSEEGYWKEFRTLSVMSLLKSASQAGSSQWSLVFIWGTVLPQESLPRHSFVDMERTLRIIFLSSPWLRSWELSHSYQAHFPPSHPYLPPASLWNHHSFLHLPHGMVTTGQPLLFTWYVLTYLVLCIHTIQWIKMGHRGEWDLSVPQCLA